jgi:hypothetical protein
MPLATGSLTFTKTIGIVRVSRWTAGVVGSACQDDVGLQANQLLRERWYSIEVAAGPTKVHPHVAAVDPAQVSERLRERKEAGLHHGLVFVVRHEHADAPHAVALLRPRRKRPRRCHTAEKRDRLAAIDPRDHSITSSAMANTPGGMVRPRAFAVLRLITSSNWLAG